MAANQDQRRISRRTFLGSALAAGAALSLSPWLALANRPEAASPPAMKTRPIPASGEGLPVVGLGTWQQFDVPSEPARLKPLAGVLKHLFRTGGSVIDSSPMYGRAESVVGSLLDTMGNRDRAFLATKVWTRGREAGIRQMERSMRRMNASTIDLMQVHNLVDWRPHLRTLQAWKKEGRVRYHGVTHYTESAFGELETVLRERDVDFVQLPYSIGFRAAEDRLLPMARDRGVAVLVNRPFQAGRLFGSVRGRPLPDWADDIDCQSWAQFFLKFILGHPAVTCVIPGTSDPEHMLENARAGTGTIPDAHQRRRMYEYWRAV